MFTFITTQIYRLYILYNVGNDVLYVLYYRFIFDLSLSTYLGVITMENHNRKGIIIAVISLIVSFIITSLLMKWLFG